MKTLALPHEKKTVHVMTSFLINLCCSAIMWEKQHQQIWETGGSRLSLHPSPDLPATQVKNPVILTIQEKKTKQQDTGCSVDKMVYTGLDQAL